MDGDRVLQALERESRAVPIFRPQDWLEAVKTLAASAGASSSASSSSSSTTGAGRKSGAGGSTAFRGGGGGTAASSSGAASSSSVAGVSASSSVRPRSSPVVPVWQGRPHLYDFKSFLKQSYAKALSTRTTDGQHVDLAKAVWFNFGVGKETSPATTTSTSSSSADAAAPTAGGGPRSSPTTAAAAGGSGSSTSTTLPTLVYHPDEVWVRYTLNDEEPWKKVRLRKYPSPLMHDDDGSSAEFDDGSGGVGVVGGADVSAMSGPLPLLPEPIQPLQRLYSLDDTPLPIPWRKARDLYELRRFIPAPYHGFYPPPPPPPPPASGSDELSLAALVGNGANGNGGGVPAVINGNETEYEEECEEDDLFLVPSQPVEVPLVRVESYQHRHQHAAGNNSSAPPRQQQHQAGSAANAATMARTAARSTNVPMAAIQPQQSFAVPGQPTHMQPFAFKLPQQQQQAQQQQFPSDVPQPNLQQQYLPPQGHVVPPSLFGGLNLQSLGAVAANMTSQLSMTPLPPSSSTSNPLLNGLPTQPAAGVGSVSVYVDGVGHMDLHTLQTLSRLQMLSSSNGTAASVAAPAGTISEQPHQSPMQDATRPSQPQLNQQRQTQQRQPLSHQLQQQQTQITTQWAQLQLLQQQIAQQQQQQHQQQQR
jgi:hypothetical protein